MDILNQKEIKKNSSNQKILDAALETFAMKGFSLTTLSDVAKISGVTQGLVSQRFNKITLFDMVMQRELDYIKNGLSDCNNVFELLLKIIKAAKVSDSKMDIHHKFLVTTLTSKDIPEECMKKIYSYIESSEIINLVKDAINDGVVIPDFDPNYAIIRFIKSTFEITDCYKKVNLPPPENSVFLRLILTKKYYEQEVEREKERFGVIASINSDFDYIGSINRFTGEANTYRLSSFAKSLLGDMDMDKMSPEVYFTLMGSMIVPEDLKYFIEATEIERVFGALEKYPNYIIDFRLMLNGEQVYYQLKCVIDQTNKDNLIIGLRSVDREKKRELKTKHLEEELAIKEELEIVNEKLKETQAFNDLFIRRYISIYSINLDTHSCTVWRRNDYLEEHYGVILNYADSLREYIDIDVHPEDRNQLYKLTDPDYIREELKDKEEFSIFYRDISQNKEEYLRAQVVKGNDPSHVAFGFSNVDTEYRARLKQETEKKEEEERLNNLFMHLLTKYRGLYHINTITKEVVPFFTERVELELGKPIEEFRTYPELIASFTKFVHPDDLPDLMEAVATVREHLMGQKTYSVEFRRKIYDTYRYSRMECVKIGDEDDAPDTVIVGFVDCDEEVKERMQYERELEDARDAADAASRAKTTFLFNMSHDIRTPMNAIIGFTQKAKRNMDKKDVLEDCLNKVEDSNEYLLRLINDVLDMARIESGKMTIEENLFDIGKRIEELTGMFKSNVQEKNLTFKVDVSGIKHKIVYMDALRTRQVISNLLSNAIKYTKPNGTIWYTVTEQPCEKEGFVTYFSEIRDNGIGMSPEFLEHIFESFSREKNTTVSGIQGTGLGMSIVKKLVDMIGGRIEIESELNVGTTVKVWFDFRISEEEIKKEEEKVELGDVTFKGMKIMLVEDNELNREIAVDILTEAGATVESAEDGTVVVEKLKDKHLSDYDVVLMDIQMPYMNGYDATRVIRSMDGDISRIPIIAMTANAFEEDKRKAFEMGMNAHVAKPIDINNLLTTIKKVLNK